MTKDFLPKWLVNAIAIALLVFGVLVIIDRAQGLTQKFQNKNPENTIIVSGEGRVKSVPDMATISLGIVTEGHTAKQVQEASTLKMNQIIAYAKSLGIPKEDIATSQFNVYPRREYKDGRDTIIGYQATQTLTAKVKGVDQNSEKVGNLLTGATENGANEIYGMSLGFSDPESLRQSARKDAIEKAKNKAYELASVAGIKLGKVVKVSENSDVHPPVFYGGAGGMAEDQVSQKAVAPTIEPGSQEVSVTMTLTFEVK